MKHPIKVIMLPTEDLSNIIKRGDDNSLVYYGLPNKANVQHSNQHVYVTISQDVEPIKKGDWIINKPSNKPHQVKDIKYLYESDRKIIATTDPKLKLYESETLASASGFSLKTDDILLPQVPQSFLKEFVANPNGKWEVEYEKYFEARVTVDKKVYPVHTETVFDEKHKLILNENNTVNITSVKDKSIFDILTQFTSDFPIHRGIQISENDIKNWIKQNL